MKKLIIFLAIFINVVFAQFTVSMDVTLDDWLEGNGNKEYTILQKADSLQRTVPTVDSVIVNFDNDSSTVIKSDEMVSGYPKWIGDTLVYRYSDVVGHGGMGEFETDFYNYITVKVTDIVFTIVNVSMPDDTLTFTGRPITPLLIEFTNPSPNVTDDISATLLRYVTPSTLTEVDSIIGVGEYTYIIMPQRDLVKVNYAPNFDRLVVIPYEANLVWDTTTGRTDLKIGGIEVPSMILKDKEIGKSLFIITDPLYDTNVIVNNNICTFNPTLDIDTVFARDTTTRYVVGAANGQTLVAFDNQLLGGFYMLGTYRVHYFWTQSNGVYAVGHNDFWMTAGARDQPRQIQLHFSAIGGNPAILWINLDENHNITLGGYPYYGGGISLGDLLLTYYVWIEYMGPENLLIN